MNVRRFRVAPSPAHLRISPALWRYLRRTSRSYDIVHAHNYHALPALAASITARQRLVFTPHYHGTSAGRVQDPAARALQARRRAHGHGGSQHHLRVGSRGAAPPPSLPRCRRAGPCDPERRHEQFFASAEPLASPGPLILSVGRIEPHKRLDRILDAVAALPEPYWLADHRRRARRSRPARCGARTRATRPGAVAGAGLARRPRALVPHGGRLRVDVRARGDGDRAPGGARGGRARRRQRHPRASLRRRGPHRRSGDPRATDGGRRGDLRGHRGCHPKRPASGALAVVEDVTDATERCTRQSRAGRIDARR